jgi:hypothetical protein
MAVATRAELIQYCLRNLGEPVVEVNVDDEQLEDRVDEALDYWFQYHFDGAERMYLKQQITASTIPLTTDTASIFKEGVTLTGGTSGATALVTTQYGQNGTVNGPPNIVYTKFMTTDATPDGATGAVLSNAMWNATPQSSFLPGETITDGKGNSAVIAAEGATVGTYDLHYFPLPDYIYGVTRVIPFNAASSSKNLFDLQYQLRLNDLYDLTSTSLIYYKTVMSHISLLNLELNGYPLYRFNRMMGRLSLDVNWNSALAIGDYIIIECYRALDPGVFHKVWNEQFFKRYVTSLFKRQWATNIKKFNGIQLPGGVTIDGATLYAEATQEIRELQDEMLNKSAPLEFFLG